MHFHQNGLVINIWNKKGNEEDTTHNNNDKVGRLFQSFGLLVLTTRPDLVTPDGAQTTLFTVKLTERQIHVQVQLKWVLNIQLPDAEIWHASFEDVVGVRRHYFIE